VPYWVDQPLGQGIFPEEDLSRLCNEYDMGWVKLLCGVRDIQGFVLSHLWVPLSR
jgi:hypothetical protein